MTMTMTQSETRVAWDARSELVESQAIFDAVVAPVTDSLLWAASIGPDQRVLDVGCGTGTLLAAGAATGAEMVGVDRADGMVRAARRRAPTATVVPGDPELVDVASLAPGRPFDLLVSRFGVMGFANPITAFANLKEAAAPGGRLVFACWREKAANPIFTAGVSVLEQRLGARLGSAPYAPGPTAFAHPDRVVTLLRTAGWDSISLEAMHFICDFGVCGDDGIEAALATILATDVGLTAQRELKPALGPDYWAALLDEVRWELRGYLVGGAVRFPGAVWLVQAANTDVVVPGPTLGKREWHEPFSA